MTLELAEGAEGTKQVYVKVTNPNNPNEFLYVESRYLDALKRELSLNENDETLSGFFGDLWNGVKGAVGGFIMSGGNPLGAVSGAITGFSKNKNNKPTAAVSTSANGQNTLTITAPGNVTPAVIAPPPVEKKDNTIMYLGFGLLGLLAVNQMTKRR